MNKRPLTWILSSLTFLAFAGLQDQPFNLDAGWGPLPWPLTEYLLHGAGFVVFFLALGPIVQRGSGRVHALYRLAAASVVTVCSALDDVFVFFGNYALASVFTSVWSMALLETATFALLLAFMIPQFGLGARVGHRSGSGRLEP